MDKQNIEILIGQLIEELDPEHGRPGLDETPRRVAKAWEHWTSGYNQSAKEILKTFEDGASQVDEMVVRKGIPFYSNCEHHLAPFFGTVTIAYIPNGKIVGLSKLDRLVEIFSRRLQVQERMTNQIANAIEGHLNPLGVGVFVKARHLCIESRGVCHQHSDTITTALRGAIKSEHDARAEFLSIAKC